MVHIGLPQLNALYMMLYYSYDTKCTLFVSFSVVTEYATLGVSTVKCSKCFAWMWKEKQVDKSFVHGEPIFSLCCAKVQIKLPNEPPTPSYI